MQQPNKVLGLNELAATAPLHTFKRQRADTSRAFVRSRAARWTTLRGFEDSRPAGRCFVCQPPLRACVSSRRVRMTQQRRGREGTSPGRPVHLLARTAPVQLTAVAGCVALLIRNGGGGRSGPVAPLAGAAAKLLLLVPLPLVASPPPPHRTWLLPPAALVILPLPVARCAIYAMCCHSQLHEARKSLRSSSRHY